MKLRTLLIDNYDSYTYNLYQLIAQVNGEPPTVIYNDQTDAATVLRQLDEGRFHNVVISPGPGTPAAAGDIGLCMALLKTRPNTPILGVCLGFQALALAHGGSVVRAPAPVHGSLSGVEHSGHPLFADIPSGNTYQVVRYHSLVVDEATLPAELQPIAWTTGAKCHAYGVAESDADASKASEADEERVLMAVAHRELPLYGVQYHPESIGTSYGAQLLRNFRDLTAAHLGMELEAPSEPAPSSLSVSHFHISDALRRIPGGAQTLFNSIVLSGVSPSTSSTAVEDTFWLDSAATDRGRFSFMGGRGGPLWRRITYRLPSLADANTPAGSCPGTLTVVGADGGAVVDSCSTFFWDWINAETRTWGHCDGAEGLPFDFWGGLVGYLGYELKAECSGQAAHQAATPDAAFFFADRVVAIDHLKGDVYALAVRRAGASEEEVQAAIKWVAATTAKITQMAADAEAAGFSPLKHRDTTNEMPQAASTCDLVGFSLREPREQYVANVDACMDALYAGDSYELCLTTELRREWSEGRWDAWQLYQTLRQVNPAPYAAWLHFGGSEADSLALCCSSPERFLRGDRQGWLEAKPIKGTAKRVLDDAKADAAAAAALAASDKDRAENLMIVDLLRNDLGRVCEPGSVAVPSLMQVESFATVHQLVSTIRGKRNAAAGVTPVDAVRAAFPGGSMTGAPKVRSMSILDGLEAGPRGVYSGSIGYFSVNGAFDLNIVIRTAVVHAGAVSIGAGGAIVVKSDADGEYEEMRLKAAPLLRAVAQCDGGGGAAVGKKENMNGVQGEGSTVVGAMCGCTLQ